MTDHLMLKLAKALASMEGKGPAYNQCINDPNYEIILGYADGYQSEAHILLSDIGITADKRSAVWEIINS